MYTPSSAAVRAAAAERNLIVKENDYEKY
jgi:hypothetical protein